MKTYKIMITIRSATGTTIVPPNPETFEAENLEEALSILAKAPFPNNNLFETIGVKLQLVEEKE